MILCGQILMIGECFIFVSFSQVSPLLTSVFTKGVAGVFLRVVLDIHSVRTLLSNSLTSTVYTLSLVLTNLSWKVTSGSIIDQS